MDTPSRVARLVKMFGGEDKLNREVPQQPHKTVNSHSSVLGDEAQHSLAIDEVIEDESTKWWNKHPQIAPPQQLRETVSATMNPTSPEHTPDSCQGETAPYGVNFCPLFAVVRFCYKWVGSEMRQPLATSFFDEGKIWKRGWKV
jgi:hypothetical protein